MSAVQKRSWRTDLLVEKTSIGLLPLMILACSGTASTPEPMAERSVIRDTPLQDEPATDAAATAALLDAPAVADSGPLPEPAAGSSAPGPSPSPRPPTPVPMRNAELATESAGAAVVEPPATPSIRSLSTGASVAELRPDHCGAMTLSDRDLRGDCQSELMRAGRAGAREFLGLLVFDLSSLPAARELLYAGLELTTLDDDFADPQGRWILRAVELPRRSLHYALSFSQILAAPGTEAGMAWRIDAAEAAPGEILSFELDEAGLEALAAHMGQGRIAFRIESAYRSTAQNDYLSWHARGEDAPLLRIAYVEPSSE